MRVNQMVRAKNVYRIAHNRWKGINSRINNPRHPSYKNYGGKGIRNMFTSIEFMLWFEKEWERMGKPEIGRTLQCGRIWHNSDYGPCNCELIWQYDNLKERQARHGLPNKEKPLAVYKNDQMIYIFKSISEAARCLGFNVGTLNRYVNGVRNNVTKYEFDSIG
jgi:hypothetical protein